jgi:hypothetical protein
VASVPSYIPIRPGDNPDHHEDLTTETEDESTIADTVVSNVDGGTMTGTLTTISAQVVNQFEAEQAQRLDEQVQPIREPSPPPIPVVAAMCLINQWRMLVLSRYVYDRTKSPELASCLETIHPLKC